MTGERDFELAATLSERERNAGVERIRRRLSGVSGRLVCDCGEPISEARRRAVPHTTKCADCATFFERRRA